MVTARCPVFSADTKYYDLNVTGLFTVVIASRVTIEVRITDVHRASKYGCKESDVSCKNERLMES